MLRVWPVAAALAVCAGGLAASGCAHAVVIASDPPGASVAVDGRELGPAPVVYDETTGWERQVTLEVRKAGYRTVRRELRQEEWNPWIVTGGVCGSVLLGTPLTIVGGLPLASLFWARQLPDRVVVRLSPSAPPSGVPAPSESAPSETAPSETAPAETAPAETAPSAPAEAAGPTGE